MCLPTTVEGCTWEKLSDGSKVELTLRQSHDDESAYCSITVQNIPQWLVQELLQHKKGDPNYRVQFSTEQGTAVTES
jgi:hypothetical protein